MADAAKEDNKKNEAMAPPAGAAPPGYAPPGYAPPATAPSMPPPPPQYSAAGGYPQQGYPPPPPGYPPQQPMGGQPIYNPQPGYPPPPPPGQPGYQGYPGQPGYPPPPGQQLQPQQTYIQVTPQTSEREAARGYRTGTGSRDCFDRLGCKRRWTRTNGFWIGGGIAVFAGAVLIFGYVAGFSLFKKTEDFQEGMCETLELTQRNDTDHFKCKSPSCGRGNCQRSYPCHVVTGLVHYGGNNHSDPVQIYATHGDIDEYRGTCSYRPQSECVKETEFRFLEVKGLRLGARYPCFYTKQEHQRVVLVKNEAPDMGGMAFPAILFILGLGMVVGIKFCGYRIGCPSPSQLIKQQQEQQQQQQQLQPLQPNPNQPAGQA